MRPSWVVACLLICSLKLFGQTDRGAITGTIADPAHAVVPNAAIEVKNVDTGAVYRSSSSATGNFTIPVPVGNYELTVKMTGFKKYVRQNLTVTIATVARQDVALEVGVVTETVTVATATSLLKIQGGEMSLTVNAGQLSTLPTQTLNGNGGALGNIRNPLAVVGLVPGAAFAADNTLRINGMPSSTYSFHIEGQDATNGEWRQLTQMTQPSTDAIQELAIHTSNYAAEYGQAGGGYFNLTMKSGGNRFHGSAYDYFVNEALNAGTPFTSNGTGAHLRNTQRRNDYGFTLGGPAWIPKVYNGHDRTFFFFNFEQFRESLNVATANQTVPTPAYRLGDFTAALTGRNLGTDPLGRPVVENAIYDPGTTRIENGVVLRNLFAPINVIPMTSLDPVALKIQGFIPAPAGSNAAQVLNNWAVPSYANFRHTTIPSFKIDHSINAGQKLSGYYSRITTFSPSADGLPQPISRAVPQDIQSNTIRINHDQTLRPTLLLHLGAGLLHTLNSAKSPPFDQSTLGLNGFYANLFPTINQSGGAAGKGGMGFNIGAGAARVLRDDKTTSNASLTWVKNNHTYKLGAETLFEGLPTHNLTNAQGTFGFSAQQTSLPWENGQGLTSTTGFNYASFLLGQTNAVTVLPPADTRLGNHSFALYLQDSWKVTRRLTVDYGLRYDYQTYLREQYGRLPNASWSTANPSASGRLGAVIYEGYGGGRCNCAFGKNYPWAIGPRLGLAYQFMEKTVLRAGFGISYGTAPTNSELTFSVGDIYTKSSPSYGLPGTVLKDGNPFLPGNPYGLAPIVWPDFNPGKYPLPGNIGGANFSIDRNAGRPPRIMQWSVGLEREVTRNLLVEAAYVGNRGVWWSAPGLADMNYNALQFSDLARYGLDINKAADRTLLTTPIGSPNVIARLPNLANPASVYPGFPATAPLNQALRPLPQFTGIPPFLGPPLGVTWYDSLQVKATKRYSHGLDLQSSFTWQKELNLGVNSDTTYLTPGTIGINDVFNRNQNKQISSLGRPFLFTVAGSYTTPGPKGSGLMRVLGEAVRDWQIGAGLRYQSGATIRVPLSNNGLFTQLARGAANNPALWGGGSTNWNLAAGQPLFLKDPNCHCFDPNKEFILNPAAWTDSLAGQFGVSAPFYNDYRWQRQASEALNIGRNFRIGPERRYNLQIRGEFQNVFNRLFLPAPVTGNSQNLNNPATTKNFNTAGVPTSGFGFVNVNNGTGSNPRKGQIVARFTF